MSACEKCWADAFSVEEYEELIRSRRCTPEEQAGPGAGRCPRCGRMTLHQYTSEPMCGCTGVRETAP